MCWKFNVGTVGTLRRAQKGASASIDRIETMAVRGNVCSSDRPAHTIGAGRLARAIRSRRGGLEGAHGGGARESTLQGIGAEPARRQPREKMAHEHQAWSSGDRAALPESPSSAVVSIIENLDYRDNEALDVGARSLRSATVSLQLFGAPGLGAARSLKSMVFTLVSLRSGIRPMTAPAATDAGRAPPSPQMPVLPPSASASTSTWSW